jgi:hypothetical protein
MDLSRLNDTIRTKKPSTKPAAPAPDVAALRARIRALKDMLAKLEADLRQIGRTERKLVRMVTRFS